MEQAGEMNNNTSIEMVNGRISVLEDLIRTLITALPIEGIATTSATSSSNTSFPELAAETVAPTIEKRYVSKKNYTQTSQSVKDTFQANKIDMNCKDSFVRISMIRGALTTAALKSMLDGHRISPVVTDNNPNGYRERSTMRINITDEISGEKHQETIFLEEDDIYCFDHDKGRLYQAVLEIF